ncbi:predicted protein [Plenodomus lingam JN3]|uniref:Predicted protein n=1 Tax=Leptosphaeria maculans (strain JN3 / isolate v23.1.3 / race Av1-4-5-6-7-8) TaxID=985895 RepID=E5ADQ5_LEPMJ|nr:predicted protein [Plenodomus lingam JN3]CBY01344.1 predicted protein [Plenodomus lingam JN3]
MCDCPTIGFVVTVGMAVCREAINDERTLTFRRSSAGRPRYYAAVARQMRERRFSACLLIQATPSATRYPYKSDQTTPATWEPPLHCR